MGKYDHIPELTGPDTYFAWKRETKYLLGTEDLWCHVSETADPDDVLGTPSHIPIAVISGAPTADETKAIRAWLVDDLKAKSHITRRLSPTVQQLVSSSHRVSARAAWKTLEGHYGRIDVSSQHVIRQSIHSLHMKDAQDASNYVGKHATLRERLLRMGAPYPEEDAIFQLLRGLPKSGLWPQFKAQLTFFSSGSSLFGTSAVALTFEGCISRISAEAARQIDEDQLNSGPGSEYANAAAVSTVNNVNSITGLRKHRNNPEGIFCTTAGCNKGDHDHAHCYGKGGGMDGQAPWQKKKKEATAAAAVTPPAPPPPAPAPAAAVAAATSMESRYPEHDLACASILEVDDSHSLPTPEAVACITSHFLTTILDSGTSMTLIKNREYFWSFSTDNPVTVRTANHGHLETSGRGECVAWVTIEGTRRRARFTNCLHAPSAMVNLLSVGWMVKQGWAITFRGDPGHCELVYRGTHLGRIPMTGALVFMDLEFILPPAADAAPPIKPPTEISAFARVTPTLDIWHARIGHVGGDAVKRLPRIAKGVIIDSSLPLSRCESCIMGKHPRQPFHSSEEKHSERFLDLIHSDVCGPMPVATPHGKRYFIVFLDDHTNILDVQLLATKDQALEAWRIVRARWENSSGFRVKIFRSDNGGEFIGAAFSAELVHAGIQRQLSAPYAHQQNGKAERVIRTLEGRMYAMLDFARLSRSLWGEAVLTAGYLFNRSESCTLPPGKTPYEMLHGVQPDFSHLRVFGARCFARIPPELQEKLGPRSREAVFMGYPPGIKGWRCRDSITGTFFNSRDVVFDETFGGRPFPDSDDEDDVPPARVVPAVPAPPLPVVVLPPALAPVVAPPPVVVLRRSGRSRDLTERGMLFHNQIVADKARLARQREVRQAKAQGVPLEATDEISNGDAILPDDEEVGFPQVLANLIITELACISIRSDSRRNPSAPGYDLKIPPATYDEALRRPDRDLWLAAMRKEINLMSEMTVYELVPLPADRKAIGCRWVLEFKEDQKGGSVNKARLVAQGFSQIPGVDFGKTFAPVAKSASIRVLSAHAALHNWELDAFDAKRAFLWGKLHEDVYMRQPPGFERLGDAGKQLVCHLLSSLYGLKQAAYDWYELLREVLGRLGFDRCAADFAVFIFNRINGEGVRVICVIAWHVDDGLAGSNNRAFLDRTKHQIAQRFGITDLGPVTKYLGIQFERDRTTGELWMYQLDYIAYLLDEHGLTDCNPVSLPMDPKFPFGRPTDVHPDVANLDTEYRKLVGELLYLAMYTRPDIALTVMRLAQHNANPEPHHYSAAKQVLRYLAGTLHTRVHYGGANVNRELHGFSDSDWASCPEDRISVSGYVWFYNGGPVSHSAKKQTTQALSSTEAEYMALTATVQDGLWLQSFYQCLTIPLQLPLQIFADNAGAIALSTEAANHIRTKHIDLRYHFIRAHIEDGTFIPVWLSTHRNTADIFTKTLSRSLFVHHRTGLSLVPR